VAGDQLSGYERGGKILSAEVDVLSAYSANLQIPGVPLKPQPAMNPGSANQSVDSVWKKGPCPRGEAIEKRLGQNLPQSYPVVDRFENGVVTSIKSIDLTRKTYLNPKNLLRIGKQYIDMVKNFQGGRLSKVEITANEIFERGLDLAIPSGIATAEQSAVLREIVKYGEMDGVIVKIIEVN
jgi:filamentous hemagglutinin